MPIDYSKWDKIELSDDSDIEVHPNVDKRSFIRWKQRDIHEKRQQRNVEIKTILIQSMMYAELNKRVDYLLEKFNNNNNNSNNLLNDEIVMKAINENFDKAEKFNYEKLIKDKKETLRKGLKDLKFEPEEYENMPSYNEMIEDLFKQIKEDHPDSKNDNKLIEYLKEHRKKIDDILSKQTIKLDELLYQKSTLISSEDIHTGFERTFLNKDKDDEEISKPSTKTNKETITTVETINNPSIGNSSSISNSSSTNSDSSINNPSSRENKQEKSEKSEKDLLDELIVLPETSEFSKIKISDIDSSVNYLLKHPKICTEQQKDALIMSAFEYQLEDDSESAQRIIYQSLLLQYISQLAGPNPKKDQIINAIKLFCSKIKDKSSPANKGFNQDVENTFNHIKNRCEIIKKEQQIKNKDKEEALIQLKALDEGTELLVNLPKEGTKQFEIFTTKLSKEMQEAVKTESLDEINKVFANMDIEDAEQVLEIFNECGVIGISGYIEDENKFKELQEQYNQETKKGNIISQIKEQNTADIVD